MSFEFVFVLFCFFLKEFGRIVYLFEKLDEMKINVIEYLYLFNDRFLFDLFIKFCFRIFFFLLNYIIVCFIVVVFKNFCEN